MAKKKDEMHCSFCGRGQSEVELLMPGIEGVCICNECAEQAFNIAQEALAHDQQHKSHGEVNPMPGDKRQAARGRKKRANEYEAERHGQLQGHVNHAHKRMRHLQLIRHQLVHMLAVRLAEILVKQDAMGNRAATVNAVNQQEDQPGDVSGPDNQHPDGKEKDECDSDAANISGEAFRLSPRTEIEEREDKHAQQTARYKDYAEDYLAFKIEGKFNNLSDNDYSGSIYNFNTSREDELFAIPEGMRQM